MQPQRSLVEDRVSRQGAGEASSAWVQCFTDQRSPRVLQCPRRPRGRARHGRPESLRLEGYSRQVPPGRGPSRITRRRTSPSLCVPTRSVGCRLGGDDRSRRHPGRPILRMPAGPCAALGRVCLDITGEKPEDPASQCGRRRRRDWLRMYFLFIRGAPCGDTALDLADGIAKVPQQAHLGRRAVHSTGGSELWDP